jgi:hypothetical protein
MFLYDSPYTALQQSLHHFNLHMGDKTDRVSACSSTKAPPALHKPRSCSTAICFQDFPLPGDTAARKVHFTPPTHSGKALGNVSPWFAARSFAHPSTVSTPLAAWLAQDRWAPDRLDLSRGLLPRDLGEPCGGISNDNCHTLATSQKPTQQSLAFYLVTLTCLE